MALSTTRSACFATAACAAARRPEFPAPFVVGVGRSGTTLLRMMLDAHPELAIPPETHFLNPLIQASGAPALQRRARPPRAVVHDERRRWNDFGLTEEDLLARVRAVKPLQHRRRGARLLRALRRPSTASRAGATRRRTTSARCSKLQKTLPEARFIHVIRDGRDAGLSQNARIAKRGKDPVPAREMARRWRKRIVKARLDAEEVDHYLEVRYEDLIADTEARPAAGLRAHRARLRPGDAELPRARRGAPAGDGRGAAGEEGASRARGGRADRRPRDDDEAARADRVAVWKREMSETENAEFEEAAGYLLDELGYETATARREWLPPEEWARSKTRSERGAERTAASVRFARPRQARPAFADRTRTRSAILFRSPRALAPALTGVRGRLTMGLLSRLKKDDARREPVPFVVGMNRSGTTLLRMMLDAHPDLTIPPETHFVPDLIKAARESDATSNT